MDNPVKILSTPLKNYYFPFEWYELGEAKHFWFTWRFCSFLHFVRFLRIPLDVPFKGLEVGCGTGILRQQIEQATHWIVDGTDLSMDALELCYTGRGQTFFYDIHDRHRSFQETYDFVILFDVLEHIQETTYFLESLFYHLKPCGWIFINVPALMPLFSNYDRAQQHFRRYDKKMMRQEFSFNASKIHDMRYWGFSLIPLLLIRKLLLSYKTSSKTIIHRGFKVPADWINTWLLKLMAIETSLIKPPPLGTSLMVAATKEKQSNKNQNVS